MNILILPIVYVPCGLLFILFISILLANSGLLIQKNLTTKIGIKDATGIFSWRMFGYFCLGLILLSVLLYYVAFTNIAGV